MYDVYLLSNIHEYNYNSIIVLNLPAMYCKNIHKNDSQNKINQY